MTSIPAVRAELKTLLETAVGPLGVQVIDGSPTSVTTLGKDVLLISKVEGARGAGSQNQIGTTTRNIPFGTAQDEYTIQLIISVSRPGPGEPTDEMVIADAIFEAARGAIDNLDEAGVYEVLPTGEFIIEPESDSNGRYVTIAFGVHVVARD